MKRFETQRRSDEILAEALVNSRFWRLQQRVKDAQRAKYLSVQEAKRKQGYASAAGVKARLLWTTANQSRLIRVFA